MIYWNDVISNRTTTKILFSSLLTHTWQSWRIFWTYSLSLANSLWILHRLCFLEFRHILSEIFRNYKKFMKITSLTLSLLGKNVIILLLILQFFERIFCFWNWIRWENWNRITKTHSINHLHEQHLVNGRQHCFFLAHLVSNKPRIYEENEIFISMIFDIGDMGHTVGEMSSNLIRRLHVDALICLFLLMKSMLEKFE